VEELMQGRLTVDQRLQHWTIQLLSLPAWQLSSTSRWPVQPAVRRHHLQTAKNHLPRQMALMEAAAAGVVADLRRTVVVAAEVVEDPMRPAAVVQPEPAVRLTVWLEPLE
jgi:hypothetical protein